MTKKAIETIISKYLNQEASPSEMEALSQWLEDENNLKVFKDYLSINQTLNKDVIYDALSAYNKTSLKIENESKVRKLFPTLLKYAAAILVFATAGYYFILNNNTPDEVKIATENNINIGTDKATLTLEDGSEVTLDTEHDYTSGNIESNGKDLIYRASNTSKKEISYNYLTIPRGGQYHVVLSDGTQVWLNSDSQLKYPVNFIDGQTRKVELVYGEAYFDVSHSSEHKGSKFKVLTQTQEIEVLGTEFNVSAYKDEDNIYTTLVNGKIALTHGEENTILKPNQQAIIKPNFENIYIIETDVYAVTAWKDGVFSFENLPLEQIMKVLSRWYDADIKFENKELMHEHFTGVLRKNQSIDEILNIIKTINNISYEIDNKTIILK
ncbi:FecR family protein [Gaetbulibacter saemankumensis]|uniref:FecR family protein n=1 Tax=Gaetbulibacter saemankumensis TaxID=311208 RepID=UPI0003F9EB05|nr:FecR family protein [Gaetbulibacter saemankumensis]